MTVRINKQKINLREKLTEFEDKVNFDEVVRGLGEYTGNVGIGTTNPGANLQIQDASPKLSIVSNLDNESRINLLERLGGDGDLGGFIRYAGGAVNNTVEIGTVLSGTDTSHIYLPRNGTGNVGIGTTSPSAKLTTLIENDSTYGNATPSSVNSVLTLINTPTSEAVNNHATLQLNLNAGTHNHVGSISLISESNTLRRGALAFCTDNGTTRPEAMRIDSAGNVGIGTTDPGAVKLVVHGSVQCIQGYRSTSTSTHDLFTLNSDVSATNSTKFKIEADGKAYTGASLLTSDDRLKHNEQEIFGAIETLSKITPKKYIKTSNLYEPNHDFQLDESGNPIDESGKLIAHHIEAGVIAQQVLNVPELKFLVTEEKLDEDGNTVWPYSLDYNSLFTYAIAAIQEQQSIIEDLKSRIETLESK